MDQQDAAAGRRSAAVATVSPVGQLFAAQQAALGELMAGMDAEARWVLLLGPDGSGKSTVVRTLLDELRLAAATVAILEARKSPDVDRLAGGLRDQLELPHKLTLLGGRHAVSDIVANQSSLGRPLVVVVDDADTLSPAGVKWLARLAASASRTETACYVVLAGTSKLEDSANAEWDRRGSGRASVRCVLQPMTSAEVRRYVDQWRRAGSDAWVKFSDAAIERIELVSKGRPGLVNEVCAHAVKLPSTRLTEQVSVEAVAETAERLGLDRATGLSPERESQTERGSRRRAGGRAALMVGTATLAALVGYVAMTRGPGLIATSTAWLSLGPRLIATSIAWLGLSEPAADRSKSDVARSRPEGVRREPAVTTRRGPVQIVTTAPSTSPAPGRRSPEKTQPAVAVEPPARQVAALMRSARDGEVGELRRLVSGGVSPNVRDVGGFTPLMAAVVNDQVPAARVLLERGAAINARAHGGITALMLAVINDRPDAMTLLLERGADVNAQSGTGWTALTFAVWKGDAGLVRTLLSHGAKPNVVDKQGWTPLDYAGPKPTPTDADPDAHDDAVSQDPAAVR